ncbi:uncharacterized protein [Henckelia pumila]|uniref:uncharacterized protein isoform X2 n=1 Tax=Henckelia pumila TaxID=405737 RepID=UPI003C6E4D22
MVNRLKEDEKNDRIIRNLLKLPENCRCINCNSLLSRAISVILSWLPCPLLVMSFLDLISAPWLKFGVVGTALTLNLSWWIIVWGLFSYTVCGGCLLSWTGFSAEALSGLRDFLKFSASSGVMLCLENWYYKILIMMTGNLENAKISGCFVFLARCRLCSAKTMPGLPPKKGPSKLKRFHEESLNRKEAEQFLCSKHGEECELSLALVSDVLGQCGEEVWFLLMVKIVANCGGHSLGPHQRFIL